MKIFCYLVDFVPVLVHDESELFFFYVGRDDFDVVLDINFCVQDEFVASFHMLPDLHQVFLFFMELCFYFLLLSMMLFPYLLYLPFHFIFFQGKGILF